MVVGELAVILLLLVLSGFFASAEVAFFGLNTFLLEREKSPLVRFVKKLLQKPVDLIITILVGNELVNIFISSLGTKLLKDTLGDIGVAAGTVVLSLLIFYLGDEIYLSPKEAQFLVDVILRGEQILNVKYTGGVVEIFHVKGYLCVSPFHDLV